MDPSLACAHKDSTLDCNREIDGWSKGSLKAHSHRAKAKESENKFSLVFEMFSLISFAFAFVRCEWTLRAHLHLASVSTQTLAILFSLKSMETPENVLQTLFWSVIAELSQR